MSKHKDDEVRNCLDVIQEECAEIIYAVSKIKRFGFDSKNPYVENSEDNTTLLAQEYGDLMGSFNLLLDLIYQADEDPKGLKWEGFFDIVLQRSNEKPSNINKNYKITKEL